MADKTIAEEIKEEFLNRLKMERANSNNTDETTSMIAYLKTKEILNAEKEILDFIEELPADELLSMEIDRFRERQEYLIVADPDTHKKEEYERLLCMSNKDTAEYILKREQERTKAYLSQFNK